MKFIINIFILSTFSYSLLAKEFEVPFSDTFSHSYKSVTAGRNEAHQRGIAIQLCETRATNLASKINGEASSVIANISNVRVRTNRGPWYDKWRETFTDMDINCSATISIHAAENQTGELKNE